MTDPRYHTADVDGFEVFFRQAGDRGKPTILLHVFPTSSHRFRDLPDADIRVLDTGPFAIETHAEAITDAIGGFLRA